MLAAFLMLAAGLAAGAAPIRGEAGPSILAGLWAEGLALLDGVLSGLDPLVPTGWSQVFDKEGPHMDPHGNPAPPPAEPGAGGSPG
ncbi:MAG TPA: hypothetical protein VF017_01730 [Thermoanaerobaculia bacterium]|nr:hypothetical protein [Thermoanaerobaculia bacterium]